VKPDAEDENVACRHYSSGDRSGLGSAVLRGYDSPRARDDDPSWPWGGWLGRAELEDKKKIGQSILRKIHLGT